MQATSTALSCAFNFLTTCAMAGVLAVCTLPKLFGYVRMDEGASTISKLYQHCFQNQGLHWSRTLKDSLMSWQLKADKSSGSRTRGSIGATLCKSEWLQNQRFHWNYFGGIACTWLGTSQDSHALSSESGSASLIWRSGAAGSGIAWLQMARKRLQAI